MMAFFTYLATLLADALMSLWKAISENFGAAASALFGTFFGAYFAFLFERRERKDDVAQKNVDALNQALFTVSEMWSILRQYQRDHLEQWRDKPDRWFGVTSNPLAAQHSNVQFEVGELYFLLSKAGNTFANLMLEQRRFRLAIGLIEQRSKLMLGVAFPRMGRANVGIGQQVTLAQVEGILGISTTHQLKEYTDQIFAFVDTDIPDFEAAYNELRAAGERLYPKAKLIRLDFNPPPEPPATN